VRLLILGLSMIVAAPAVAAPPVSVPPVSVPPVPEYAPPPTAPILPPVLTDPAMADQVGNIAGVLTRSLMNLPVGEVEAAIEGRVPTRADRQRTVRDSIGDPYLAERVADQAAASGRTVQVVSQAATRAIVASLPAILGAVDAARADIERAVGNLPDPTYPRR
jgi:hypothetical protein